MESGLRRRAKRRDYYYDLKNLNAYISALEVKDQTYLSGRAVCVAIQNAWREHMLKFYERSLPAEFLDHTFQDFLRYAPPRLLKPKTMETATSLMVYFGTNNGVANIEEILREADKAHNLRSRAAIAICKFSAQNFATIPGYSGNLWLDQVLDRLATRDDIDVVHMLLTWLCGKEGNNLLWNAIKEGRIESRGDGSFTPPAFKFLEDDVPSY